MYKVQEAEGGLTQHTDRNRKTELGRLALLGHTAPDLHKSAR